MAQPADITPILQNAQSADAGLRTQAEQQLKHFQEQNYSGFLVSLAAELANSEKPVDSRRLAGLILKNTLDAKDEHRKVELTGQWLGLDAGLRQQIKQALLATLGTQAVEARHTAALVIAKIAAIELPQKAWPELIQQLLNNMGVQPPNSGLKQSTLEALGYICEEMGNMKEECLEQQEVNNILTAVVQGMRKDEPDPEVRYTACVALYNALEFAHTNFDNENERNYIMQMVCEGTLAPAAKIRRAAFECLVKTAANYYEKLPAYMSEVFKLTYKATKEDEEEVALQALEFWCTVCEEEIDLDKVQDEGDSSYINHHFIKQALSVLVPMLLEQLTKQEEGQDQDDTLWNLSMAAGTCLGLVAATVGNDIVPLVMPYVQDNIGRHNSPEEWRYREAATFAFGSILEGPSVAELVQLVTMGLGFLLHAMKDPNPQVKNTTAWTIGRIFEFVHGDPDTAPVVNAQTLPQIVQVLLESIKDEAHIAEKTCYALSQLASGFAGEETTSPLSPYFKDIIQALLETAARPCDVHEQARLQVQAFEAINEVVRSSASDTLQLVAQLIPLMIAKLQETLRIQATTAEEQERQIEIQGLLCGCLQVIIQKLTDTDASKVAVTQYADSIMECLLAVFAYRHATVHEEAMLAVGALTYACGAQFSRYMESFFPVLEMGLANYQEWQVCQVTVGVLGDITRAMEEQIYPYCDRIMSQLMSNLQSNEVHRNIKPQILSCFGDIALAIADKFEMYLMHVLQMLQSAQQLSISQTQLSDDDLFDYNNLLRVGIFEAYSGIFNGLSKEKCDQYLPSVTPGILEFIEFVYNDKENVDERVLKAAVALVGDIASNLSYVGTLFLSKPFIQQFVVACRNDPETADAGNWAAQAITKAVGSG